MNIRIEAVYEYLNRAPPWTNSGNINMINSRLGGRSEYYTHHCLQADCDLQGEVRSHYANTSTLFKYRGTETMTCIHIIPPAVYSAYNVSLWPLFVPWLYIVPSVSAARVHTLYILTYSTLPCLFTCILLHSTAFCTCGWMLNCISLPQCSMNPVYSPVSSGYELTFPGLLDHSPVWHVCFTTKPFTDPHVGHERSRAASTNNRPLWCGVLNTRVCPFPALKHELLRGHSNKKEKKKLAALQITGIHQFVCVEVSSIEVHS